jgi:hypothetical protein
MRDEALWDEIRAGGHGVAALEVRLLEIARKRMPGIGADAEAALADALRRVAYLAMVADAPVVVPPMLHMLFTLAAKRQNDPPAFMRQIRRLGFGDTEGYRATQQMYASAFGAPPPSSAIWPAMRILQQMRALEWALYGGTGLLVLGIVLDRDAVTWVGVVVTAGFWGGTTWLGRRLGWATG